MSDEVSLSKGWALEAYIAHNESMRDAEERFSAERDRRYTEVALEREKALKIKETADLAALGLAREIQTYKDEKANELREQIGSERGLYVTKSELVQVIEKMEATIKPALDFVTSQQGRSSGYTQIWAAMIGSVILIGGLLTILATIVGAALYISRN